MAKRLNDILDAAIKDEIAAQKFYLGALVNVINKRDVPSGRLYKLTFLKFSDNSRYACFGIAK